MQFERNNRGQIIKNIILSVIIICILNNSSYFPILITVNMILLVLNGILGLWNFSYKITARDGIMIIESQEEDFKLSFSIEKLKIEKFKMSIKLDDGMQKARISCTEEMYLYIEKILRE